MNQNLKFYLTPHMKVNLLVRKMKKNRSVLYPIQKSMIRALKDWVFEPLPLPFTSFAPFGGAFHCATLDIRRRGSLQSYFD